MARIALGMTNDALASRASVGVNTVSRFEQGQDVRLSSVEAMRRALEEAGATFISEGEASLAGGPGVRLSASDR